MKHKIESNFDDSSDEEYVVDTIKTYSLKKNWEEFCEYEEYEEDDYDKQLPFIAHAFGIGLLYSENVGDLYYGIDNIQGLKTKYLSSVITPQILTQIIDKALLQTLKMFYDDIDEDKFQKVKDALKINDKLKTIIEGIPDGYDVGVDTDDLFKIKITDAATDEFFDLATKAIDDAINETIEENSKDKADSHLASFYYRGSKAAIPYLENAGIITDNETVSSRRSDPHIIAEKTNDFEDDDKAKPDFPKETCEAIIKSFTGKKKNFESLISEKAEEIAQAFFEDCTNNEDIFRNQIRQNLCEIFLMEVRKDLPDAFLTQQINSPLSLLANLRLSNRSATRKMRRLDLTSQINADAFGEFFDMKTPSTDSRAWNMNGTPVRESQQVDDSHSRVDLVFESDAAKGGSYPVLYQTLSKFCEDKKLSEAVFVRLIKFNLGTPGYKDNDFLKTLLQDKSLKQFVAKLSYLLFGCEVARNPASLIMHQMMLDLIEYNKKSWKDFFDNNQLMPMALGDAVSKARNMHSKFSDYMPWPYKYDGKEKESADLEKAEKELFLEWLKYKDIDPQFATEALLSESNRWYGIHMRSTIKDDDEDLFDAFLKKLLEKDTKDIRVGEYALLNNLLKKYYVEFDKKLLKKIRSKQDPVLSRILFVNAESETEGNYELEDVYDNSEDEYTEKNLKELLSEFLTKKIKDKKDEEDLEMAISDLLDVCDINYFNSTDESLLLYAAFRGYVKLFSEIIKIEDCNTSELMCHFGSNNDTPAMHTIQNDWIDEIEKLIDDLEKDTIDERYNGDDDDENDNKSILYFAIDALERCEAGNHDLYDSWAAIINKILKKEANPNLTYTDVENAEYNCLTYAISKLWKDELIDDLSATDKKLCKNLYKAALRIKNGKDKTGIKEEEFYEGSNQAYFNKWEKEVKDELKPSKSPAPKSGIKVIIKKTTSVVASSIID